MFATSFGKSVVAHIIYSGRMNGGKSEIVSVGHHAF